MKKLWLFLLWFILCLNFTKAGYTEEFPEAYTWAYSNSITTQPTIETANMYWEITRIELSKMISNYAINVLNKQVDMVDVNLRALHLAKMNSDLNNCHDINIFESNVYSNVSGKYSSIISVVVLFLYFGLFQYYTDGKTVGKLALRIKVNSTKGKLKLSQMLIRSAIINSIFIKAVTIICLFLMSKNLYNTVNMYLEFVNIGLLVASGLLVVIRNDGVGLHDLLAHTKVERINKNAIREANYKES